METKTATVRTMEDLGLNPSFFAKLKAGQIEWAGDELARTNQVALAVCLVLAVLTEGDLGANTVDSDRNRWGWRTLAHSLVAHLFEWWDYFHGDKPHPATLGMRQELLDTARGRSLGLQRKHEKWVVAAPYPEQLPRGAIELGPVSIFTKEPMCWRLRIFFRGRMRIGTSEMMEDIEQVSEMLDMLAQLLEAVDSIRDIEQLPVVSGEVRVTLSQIRTAYVRAFQPAVMVLEKLLENYALYERFCQLRGKAGVQDLHEIIEAFENVEFGSDPNSELLESRVEGLRALFSQRQG
jgi:hypothetical protein